MREGGQRKSPVLALLEIIWEMLWIFFDGDQGTPEFCFETVGDFRTGFLLVVKKDVVEILLNERMEGEPAAHQGDESFLRAAIPLQNSDSVSGGTEPDSNSESRRIASWSVSSGSELDATLRSSSLASLRRERFGSFIAKLWISDAEFIKNKLPRFRR